MNIEQVTEFLNDGDNVGLYGLTDLCHAYNSDKIQTPIGEFAKVEIDGCIADGVEYRAIISIDDILIAVPCCYSSWDDSDYGFNQAYQVKPVEKTITVYEKI